MEEKSESGAPIYRYETKEQRAFIPATGDENTIEHVSNHIEKVIGEIALVFHEIVSDIIHIDIYWIKPTEERPFHTLVTSGMSDLPMTIPEGYNINKYCELCILLPPSWNIETVLSDPESCNEEDYWPIRWLKIVARFVHEYKTWVGYGHTIPNGENAEGFASNTKLGCMMLLPSTSLGNEFFELKVNEEKSINFYCLYPIYKEEMDFKIKKGSDALINKLSSNHVLDIVDKNRINVCLKKGLFGLW